MKQKAMGTGMPSALRRPRHGLGALGMVLDALKYLDHLHWSCQAWTKPECQ